MNKKNSGFSLVELIVVIAIMAVLVGVLAPAYLKYVEKSRKSADLDTIDGVVKALDSVVADDDYEDAFQRASAATPITFEVKNATGTLTWSVTGATGTANNKNALQCWEDVANAKSGLKLKSKVAKKGTDILNGTLQDNGAVKWALGNTVTGIIGDTQAKSFKNKLGLS